MTRLPTPGGDDNVWGDLLNQFLLVSHDATGALLPGIVNANALASNAVSNGNIQDGTIAETKLAAALQTKIDSATDPVVGGVLSGTASTAQINAGAITTGALADASVTPPKLTGNTPSSGNVLSYSGTDFAWAPPAVTSVAGKTGAVTLVPTDVGAPTTLAALTDVSGASGATTSQVLTYTGSNWAPATVTSTTVSDATTSTKGIVQLAGDLAGTATSPSVAKLNGITVSGTPSSGNVLTASSSSAASWQTPTSAPDATTSSKGIVQLAGDLGGTATVPTVPALALKATDTAVVHNTGNETVAGVKTFTSSPSIPNPTNNGDAASKSYVDGLIGTSAAVPGTVQLDSFSGTTDDDKLTAALTYVQAQTNMPAIQLPTRNLTFSLTRTPFSGLRIIGSSGGGPKNLELSSGKYVPSKVTLNCGSGTSSWFYGTGTYYDIYFSNIAFQYGSGASFWYQPSGTLYACEFNSLTHYGPLNVFGSNTTKALLTQTIFSGHWTVVGNSGIPFYIGGSDNNFWTSGYLNIQGSGSTAGAGNYLVWLSDCQKSVVANMYVTAVNGWRGIRISGGASGYGLSLTGCRTEGANTGNPNVGVAVLVEGGGVTFRDHWAAYSMTSPSAGENGVIQITGGNVLLDRVMYNRGNALATVSLVYCSAGQVTIRAFASSTGDTMYATNGGGTIIADTSVTTN